MSRVPNECFGDKFSMESRNDIILEVGWCVDEFLKEMDRLELTENTLVVLISDNGLVLDDSYQN